MATLRSHAPPDYDCPFCRVLRGEDLTGFYTRQSDVVLRTPHASAFIAARWWPGNAGHVLVVPNQHVENLYHLEPPLLGHVYGVVRRVALAVREAYGCEGVSTRQHNEPASHQEVWHFHCHVFPATPGMACTSARTSIAGPRQKSARPTPKRCAPGSRLIEKTTHTEELLDDDHHYRF